MTWRIFVLAVISIIPVGAGIVIAVLKGIDGVLFGAGASAIVGVVGVVIGQAIRRRRGS